MKKPITESDLYEPIQQYLIRQGYTVRSEVNHCDITAVKEDELIIIEMKRGFNTILLLQATQRQKISDSVYVALPFPHGGIWSKKWRQIEHLLKRLQLGLILVKFQGGRALVHIQFHPVPFSRRKQKRAKMAILREIEGRSDEYNRGGSVRKKLVTAYREQAIFIACCLEKHGELTPKQLRNLGTGPKTQPILYANHYGWFDRCERGVYCLKPKGKKELETYPDLVQHYREKIENNSVS